MNWKIAVKNGWNRLKPAIIFDENMIAPKRYQMLFRNIVAIMLLVSFIPLISMTVINHTQYQNSLRSQTFNPLRLLVNKTAHSLELFLDERLSVIRFIAASRSYDSLSQSATLNTLYQVLKKEIGGIVDLGVINKEGKQVAYAGPYDLLGRDYSQQSWFHEVALRGYYISDVFMGYRGFPHIAIAVQQFTVDGRSWTLRATIDTRKLNGIIQSMGLEPESDAFFINQDRILQTPSRYYGHVLESCRLNIPSIITETYVEEITDDSGRPVIVALANIIQRRFILVVAKPRSVSLRSWYTLQNEMLIIFIAGATLIIISVFTIARFLVKKIREADEKRELAFREIENAQKLSSLGNLAAGVAHEINNPMAIIDQKAGLMVDLIKINPEFKETDKFLKLTESILQNVGRCKSITHRLLGFARRIEVTFEEIDLNRLIKEVLGFMEKEALYRNIALILKLDDALPTVARPQPKSYLPRITYG
ncbi:two-component sensor histidine kinase [bacterium]|nr:two-component sensor histidine kinase [bacterium]